jgi:hypothetical protein
VNKDALRSRGSQCSELCLLNLRFLRSWQTFLVPWNTLLNTVYRYNEEEMLWAFLKLGASTCRSAKRKRPPTMYVKKGSWMAGGVCWVMRMIIKHLDGVVQRRNLDIAASVDHVKRNHARASRAPCSRCASSSCPRPWPALLGCLVVFVVCPSALVSCTRRQRPL